MTLARVRRWRKKLIDSGVSAITVAKAYRLLRAVFNTALDDEMIKRNIDLDARTVRVTRAALALQLPPPCLASGPGCCRSGRRPLPRPAAHRQPTHRRRGREPQGTHARMGQDSERAALIYLHSSAGRQRALADEVSRMATAALAKAKSVEPSGTQRARKPNGPVNPSGGILSDLGK